MVFLVPFLLAGTAALAAQPVDFKLQSTPVVIAAGPLALAGPPEQDQPDTAEAPPPAKPHFFMAYGFGHQVPLDFAVRQVVPPRVHISWGQDVDRNALVSWDGGQTWDRVLRAAIKPLGLHAVVGSMAVKIVE